MSEYDVAIVGGGLVGASLAVALSDSKLRVALIEVAPPPASEPSWDERCIALNDASFRIFSALGVWPAMAGDAAPITATHISERGRFGVARFSADEAGLEALGYNLPLRAIGAALWQRLQAAANVRIICPARVESVAVEDAGVRLSIAPATAQLAKATPSAAPDAVATRELSVSSSTIPSTLTAKLVVAADGARSAVREMLGIAAETRDYHQSAIVSAVRLSRPHNGVAYERFMPGGPLALIPKGDKACSLVWTRPQDSVEALLALDDADYLAQANEAFGNRLGRFTELGRRWAYPLARVMTEQLTSRRVVFVGNAAQSLHPVAAQGFNLGLRDVAALADLIRAESDPGSADVLSAYEARRTRDRDRVSGITDLMVRVFSNRIPGLSQARHWGLVAVDLAPGLRESVMRQHLGHLGLSRVS
jgi:2-octaprenyl-6-methoxyphenol hydroxylase